MTFGKEFTGHLKGRQVDVNWLKMYPSLQTHFTLSWLKVENSGQATQPDVVSKEFGLQTHFWETLSNYSFFPQETHVLLKINCPSIVQTQIWLTMLNVEFKGHIGTSLQAF